LSAAERRHKRPARGGLGPQAWGKLMGPAPLPTEQSSFMTKRKQQPTRKSSRARKPTEPTGQMIFVTHDLASSPILPIPLCLTMQAE
jgi:hypothetical protein